jgi:hypothetical protein
MSKLRKWLTGSEVMKRLDISSLDLYELAEDNRPLRAYDPFTGRVMGDYLQLQKIDVLINPLRLRGPGVELEKCYFLVSQVEALEKTQQKPKPRNEDKWDVVRRKAAELWKSDPTITIADMASRDEITLILGRNYADKTIKEHIKDLCPNRNPGRRPDKK